MKKLSLCLFIPLILMLLSCPKDNDKQDSAAAVDEETTDTPKEVVLTPVDRDKISFMKSSQGELSIDISLEEIPDFYSLTQLVMSLSEEEKKELGLIFIGSRGSKTYILNDLEGLSEFPKLRVLSVSSNINFLNDTLVLDPPENIKTITIFRNRSLKEIRFTHPVPSLEELELSGPELDQFPDLSMLPNLKLLDLSENNIPEIPAGPEHPLEKLILSLNPITSLENVERFPHLKWLVIDFAGISTIENLDNMKELEYINLGSNKIEDISYLMDFPSLVQISMSYNKITEIPDLSSLPNLKTLDLKGNDLTSMENLKTTSNLSALNIQSNNITHLTGIKKCFKTAPGRAEFYLFIDKNPYKTVDKEDYDYIVNDLGMSKNMEDLMEKTGMEIVE